MLSSMHGDLMIDKDAAKEIKNHALNAITQLTLVLGVSESRCSPEEYDAIKRGVGLSIGRVETELLGLIYTAYPELDDLT